ncbi:MAG: urocanate hydratase [Candidatus Cloacimonetes bacterium 4572_55]|nr:MAG: urocanate hydratase [Candidatus Cloacimonetes bacterium 4572_55]
MKHPFTRENVLNNRDLIWSEITGSRLHCRNWQIEAPLRMLINNLLQAARPEELIVYGGTGRAARNWDAFDAIVSALLNLEPDQTLLIQSGKPVAILRTHSYSPRVLISNSMIVPIWDTDAYYDELWDKGLMMYGQMTAGSWIFIGQQGIIQGTYETFAAASQPFGGSLKGKFLLTGGLGNMGGAQALAATMCDASAILVDFQEQVIDRVINEGFCDVKAKSIQEALDLAIDAKEKGKPLSIGLLGNAAEVFPAILEKGKADPRYMPDVVTDQTSAHEPMSYYPIELPLDVQYDKKFLNPNSGMLDSDLLARYWRPREEFVRLAKESMSKHVQAMLGFQDAGATVFDYGNGIRKYAEEMGVTNAMEIQGFVLKYVRPLFCEGRGPFRWVALSGNKEDIFKTDEVVMREFSDNKLLVNWIKLVQEKLDLDKQPGLPARVCWLGYGERARMGRIINDMVASGEISAPIVVGRDHLDCGSVASPLRETEGMRDGSDAVADWAILNALVNTASGATWVSLHDGGGVGHGKSIHAGQVTVLDGTPEMASRLERVFTNDPGMGIARHVDAGYERAIEIANQKEVAIPMLNYLSKALF